MADKLARLKELSYIIAEGPDAMRREFTMRVPAEPDRDADLVIMWAATEIAALRAENAELRKDVSQAATDVLAERQRQQQVEGWTPEHDDQHDCGEMASAAGCYAMFTQAYPAGDPPRYWPWDKEWWKPKGPRRNLVRAAALLIAEIERLDRAGGTIDADLGKDRP